MSSVLITDCYDDNALARVDARMSALTDDTVSIIRVPGSLDESAQLAAGGNLIDTIDAIEGRPGIIVVNVAPRRDDDDNENGSLFCYFWVRETLVVATIDGYTLSLVKAFGLVSSVGLLHTDEVVRSLEDEGLVDTHVGERIVETQFRSFEFVPYTAASLYTGIDLPYEEYALENVVDAPDAIWWVDNFGNAKTTVTPASLSVDEGGSVETAYGTLPFYDSLADAPDGAMALVQGSSGIDETRFIEVVKKGANAAETYGIEIGDGLFAT